MKKTQTKTQAKTTDTLASNRVPNISLVPRRGILLAAMAMEDGIRDGHHGKNDWKKDMNNPIFVEDKYNHAMKHLIDFNSCGLVNKFDLSHAIADLCLIAEAIYNY